MNGKRRTRLLARIGAVVGALVLGAAAFLSWVLGTQAGARWAFARITSAMKGSVRVASLQGPIRGPLAVRGLVYETPAMTVSVEEVRLDWRLSELLAKRLDVVSLSARGVRIRTSPAPEKKEKEKLPDLQLPINVIVRAADVRDVEMTSGRPSPGPPVRVDSISLATRVAGFVVRVDRLAVRGPTFTADVSGTLEPRGDYPLDLTTAWSVQAKDTRYEGRGTLAGTLESLRVTQTLLSPAPLEVEATLLRPLRDLGFSGDVRFDALDLRRLVPSAPAASASGSIHAEGALTRFSTRGVVRLETKVADVGRLDASWDAERRGDLWRVARLDVRLPEGTTARISGSVRTAEARPAFDLAAEWTRVEWPLKGTAAVASSHGNLKANGTLDGYRIVADADVRAKGLPPGTWRLESRGDARHVALERLSGGILGGSFTASGAVAWKPNVTWDLDVSGEGLDPAGFWPSSPGRLAFRASTRGVLEDAGPNGSVSLTSLGGTLRGRPVSGAAEARFANSELSVPRADFRVATARLEGSGRIGRTWDFAWRVEAPDVGAVLPDARGSLSATGRLTGPRKTPRVRMTADGRSLALGAREIARLRLDADVSTNRELPSRVDLDTSGTVLVAGRTLEALTLRLAGTLARHDVAVTARTAKMRLAFAASGGAVAAGSARDEGPIPAGWDGRVTRLDLASPDVSGRLARPAAVSASADAVRVRDFAWAVSGGRLTLDGEWRKAGPSRMEAGIANVPLAVLSPWLPAGMQLTGPLNGRVRAAIARGGDVDGDVDLRPGPGEIRYANAAGRTVAFSYSDTKLELSAGPRGATAKFSLAVEGQGRIGADLAMPDYNARGVPQKSEHVRGRVTASFADLGFARALLPGVDDLGGALRADVAFDGTVGNPGIRGAVTLADGRAELSSLGITVADVSIAARGDGGPVFHVEGTARSGDGTVRITGSSPLAPAPDAPASLKIEGRRFQAMGTDTMQVWVSPDLTIVADGRKIRVEGRVLVPQTRIEYVQKFATIQPSKDIVFVGPSAEDEETARAKSAQVIEARVRLVLGDFVRVKTMGFDGRLTGSILAIDEAGRPTTATGELDVVRGGTYKAYGQDLTIERGRVVFGGPVANPAVDLRASRKADDGTIAGVEVKGTVRNPEVSVWSEPSMSQTDALAYLVLGHPLGQATTPEEGSAVAKAATSLGIAGGNLLGKKIASRFGLETARVEAKHGLESAALVVGKYLSPKLYVEYGIGLFDPVSTLRLRYILSRKWSVSAETSGEANGADVLYTVDAGKRPPSPPPTEERAGSD